ncbi:MULTISPECIES: 3-dehydroquinate synthase [unclassified Janibacter]|uniref:3-dehydroquinate synthase n=1 Tax=unclassified Janibacter TaxID=2649294 RepID=UPI003D055525
MSEALTRIAVGDDYDVLVGRGVSAALTQLVAPDVARVLVVHPAPLPELAEPHVAALRESGREVLVAGVPDAEAAKTAEVAADLWAQLGRAGFTRSDAVVGVGGGSVTDLAGFVAATWLRGVAVIQVPTTVLGMVDAAVGGKTGINTAEGKNLVGAFHPPVGVLCDLTSLDTLPRADLVAGLAEVVKGGFIRDARILDLAEADPAALLDVRGPALREVIERKIAVKADVVARDLRESSLREILNYGHTFAHAIEQVEGYRVRHGEAVAIGMVYAAEVATRAGVMSPDLLARHRNVLTGLGLPTTYRPGRWDELLAAMRRDKKTRGATLRFVVLEDVGRPTRLEGPSEDLLREAYDALT